MSYLTDEFGSPISDGLTGAAPAPLPPAVVTPLPFPGPTPVDVADYVALIQPQHRGRPRFLGSVKAAMQPLVDTMNLLAWLPQKYDLDTAEGAQLDAVGEWVGVNRHLTLPVSGVFFAWDTAAVGWDQGKWRGPTESTTQASVLDDTTYRMLIRARIASNHWDGTLAGAADAYGYIFPDKNTHVFIQDNQDHTFSLNVAGRPLSLLQMALLTGGYLPMRPVGVRLASVNTVSVGGAPLFGWDNNTPLVGGWGTGAWGIPS